MSRVLFVCADNAGSSQMARALFEQAVDQRHSAESAAPKPAPRVLPAVVEAMRERGIDISGRNPQKLTVELAALADVVVTIGFHDASYPIPATRTVGWDLPDPDGLSMKQVRAVRDQIEGRVADLVKELDRATGAASAAA